MRGSSNARLLSIDPGSIKAGFAVLEMPARGAQPRLCSSGTIFLNPDHSLAIRLHSLADDLDHIIDKYKPSTLALESLFFAKNAKSVLQLSQARGVILMKAGEYGMSVHEYSPAEIKKNIAGSGRATKEQIEKMIRLHLKLPSTFKLASSDQSDAIAIGLYHLSVEGLNLAQGARRGNDRLSFWQGST